MRSTLARPSPAWTTVLVFGALCAFAEAARPPTITCVSVNAVGQVGDGVTTNLRISSNGRFNGMMSDATNLVPGDTNGVRDVFLHDRKKGTMERISLAYDGSEGDAMSAAGGIDARARFVVFHSDATNLVPGDTNGLRDIFVRDLRAGDVERVSLTVTGEESDASCSWPAISPTGRYVVFTSAATNLVPGDTNGVGDVFVYDRRRGGLERVSLSTAGDQPDAGCGFVSISKNGRWVAFQSEATNLVPGDTNGVTDVFLRDRKRGTTARVSVGPGGDEADARSYAANMDWRGRRISFSSDATNLVDGDTNGVRDSFVYDRKLAHCTRVSVSSTGEQGNSSSYHSHLSPKGRYVGISSHADNLVPGDANGWHDVFLRDLKRGTTILISTTADGRPCDGDSWRPRVSRKGRVVSFYSFAPDVIAGDSNGVQDVFVWRRWRR